jgi:hypothetical protein
MKNQIQGLLPNFPSAMQAVLVKSNKQELFSIAGTYLLIKQMLTTQAVSPFK